MALCETDPTVSVIIPFYGSPENLERALRSVEAQSFEGDIETLVIVDGPSGDLEQITKEHPSVRFIYQDNQGPGSARNLGISLAKGDFIAFLDADDSWRPDKLSVQIGIMQQQNAGWSQHSYVVVDSAGTALKVVDTSRYCGNVLRDTLLSFRVQTSTVVVHKSCLADPRVRFGTDRVGEDGYLYARLAENHSLTAIRESLGFFTWHGKNAGGQAELQLWSRARTWNAEKDSIRDSLPVVGQIAYRWCAIAASLLGYPTDDLPRNANSLIARIFYAPSYTVFQLLAKGRK